LLELAADSANVKKGGLWGWINQNIKVAGRIVKTLRHRAKDPSICSVVGLHPLPEGEGAKKAGYMQQAEPLAIFWRLAMKRTDPPADAPQVPSAAGEIV
jgi:hypothetical protein